MKLRDVARSALDLVYPPVCGGCGRVGVGWWCESCDRKVVRFRPFERQVNLLLEDGRTLPVISVAAFQPVLREAIHAFKFTGSPQLSEPFGDMLIEAWSLSRSVTNLIVPVPLHPDRQRERGYNQSERLAREVASRLEVPTSVDAIRRIRNTEQQALLDALAREKNVRDAFVGEPAKLAGKRLLMIDDVFTTGATLRECARAAYAAGAAEVIALTLARA